MKPYKIIRNSVLLFIGIVEFSAAEEILCHYKNVGSEIKIINFENKNREPLTVYIGDQKNGVKTFIKNAGLLMGCFVEGLALLDVDQSLIVDDRITIKFRNKGSEVIIEKLNDNSITQIKLTRLEAIEMAKVISKYYGFPISAS